MPIAAAENAENIAPPSRTTSRSVPFRFLPSSLGKRKAPSPSSAKGDNSDSNEDSEESRRLPQSVGPRKRG